MSMLNLIYTFTDMDSLISEPKFSFWQWEKALIFLEGNIENGTCKIHGPSNHEPKNPNP